MGAESSTEQIGAPGSIRAAGLLVTRLAEFPQRLKTRQRRLENDARHESWVRERTGYKGNTFSHFRLAPGDGHPPNTKEFQTHLPMILREICAGTSIT